MGIFALVYNEIKVLVNKLACFIAQNFFLVSKLIRTMNLDSFSLYSKFLLMLEHYVWALKKTS
jgi:hypothetical protein